MSACIVLKAHLMPVSRFGRYCGSSGKVLGHTGYSKADLLIMLLLLDLTLQLLQLMNTKLGLEASKSSEVSL